MELLGEYETNTGIERVKFSAQRDFIEYFVYSLLQELEEFDFCVVNILKKQYLYRLFECIDSCEATTFLFKMAETKEFDLLARSSDDNFEVVTVFDRNFGGTECAFGKPDGDRVP